jgi:sugar phosphate isomerase/epimerase
MLFGAMNFPIRPVLDEIHAVGALGFDYLELAMDAPEAHYRRLDDQRDAIRAALERYHMTLICHLPTFIHTADLTASIREASREELLHSLATARRLGARKIVLHPSFVSGMGRNVPEIAHRHALQSLDAAARESQKLGCRLCLENLFSHLTPFTGPDDFAAAFERWPDLHMTLDVGHAFIDGRGMDLMLELIHRFGKRIHHVHISDNNGRRDDHLAVGAGGIDFRALIEALKTIDYDETMTLEIFTPDRADLVDSRAVLQHMIAGG